MAIAPAETELKQEPVSPLTGWGFRPEDELEDGEQPPTILVLEGQDIQRRLLRGMLKSEGYRLLEASGPDEALELLRHEKVDLVILDVKMPETSGLDLCRKIKARRTTRLVPVLVLTAIQHTETEMDSLASGADEFLVLPLQPEIVRMRIRSMLRHKAAIDSLEDAEGVLFALAQAIEQRDRTTHGHCERLSAMAMTLGMALGLSRTQLLALHRGGFLHDIGKISVPDHILFKAGSLSAEEWRLMQQHTVQGEAICRHTKSLAPVLPIIRSHHERWDGSGYPDGLRGEEIPLLARILQVVDIFDALTSERPYKPALPAAEALAILEDEARHGWRDPKLVALLRNLYETPLEKAVEQALIPCPPPERMQQSLLNMHRALASPGESFRPRSSPA